ncbi:hypothetical protein GOODEAATRI_032911 [Goodea atripinnis]|uniref:Uncharacterized protein n=1 Tax=Goodea atripinnis TaxID=208336 RepID=A0ABV0PJ22_9TELE
MLEYVCARKKAIRAMFIWITQMNSYIISNSCMENKDPYRKQIASLQRYSESIIRRSQQPVSIITADVYTVMWLRTVGYVAFGCSCLHPSSFVLSEDVMKYLNNTSL